MEKGVELNEEEEDKGNEGDMQHSDDSDSNEIVLAVVWGGGKLGAAYYNLRTSEMFLLPDTVEAAPDFEVLRALFKQLSPKIVLACSRQDPKFLEILKKLSGDMCPGNESAQSGNSSVSASAERNILRPHLFIEPGKEFAPDPCKRRLQELRLPFEPIGNDDQQHLYFITSLIPFSNIQMIRTTGALLRFLDKRGVELLQLDLVQGLTPVLDVKICTMDDLVLVDHTAWDSLQVFNMDLHPSVAKHGTSGSKEGLSIYGLFNNCMTTQGSTYMRLQFLRPTRNLSLLKRRHDVIEHCVNSAHTGFVESAVACLKAIKHIPKLLLKLSLLHASVKEWKALHQTLHTCVILGELASSQPDTIELFKAITAAFKTDITVAALAQEIRRIVDFDQSVINRRFYPQVGINEELDRKRLQYNALPEVMAMVASEEMQTLPGFVDTCCIVYIPEVGYLLAIKIWANNLTPDELILDGLEYKFTSTDLAYYKSPRTHELDLVLGDSQVAILELETYIMIALTENIMQNSSCLVKVNSLVSELDSLMTMAAVARDRKFVRPELIEGGGKLTIVDGRHPLMELNSDFVPNSTYFDAEERIVMLTGPNASGKSIYLKQVGMIVLLGLCGSFVPATSAIIPTFDRICTRIYAHESISVGLSTFMLDLNQISLALRNSTKSSLIIVDEFGKGTSEIDGISLLQATLEDFAGRRQDCPTLFVSTHYYSLSNRLPESPVFKRQTMHFMTEGDKVIYLFTLKDGSCESSFAYMVAFDAGTPATIIKRSIAIEPVIRGQDPEESLKPLKFQKDKEEIMLMIAEQFLDINLEEVNPVNYLNGIRELMCPYDTPDDLIVNPTLPTAFPWSESSFSDSLSNVRSGNRETESDTSSLNPSTPPRTTAATNASLPGDMLILPGFPYGTGPDSVSNL